MIINNVQTNFQQPTIYNSYQSKPFTKTIKFCNTKPLTGDTFTPSISFKATIHEYAKNGRLESLIQELNSGVDINTPDENGNTPLHVACYYNRENIVKYLLEQDGIDINIKSKNGNTPLHRALDDGKTEIVEPLLDCAEIDLTIKNNEGWIALDRAQRYYTERPYFQKLKELTEYQLAHPESVGKFSSKNPPININKLSPEENVWTKEEITKLFIKLINKDGDTGLEDALKMLENTPLINFDSNNKEVLRFVAKKGSEHPDFMEKVFDYKFHKQAQMQEEYNARRKEFLENTIKSMGYEELHFNNVALNTIDGFKILMEHPEFNPNDTVENNSLFEKACNIDPEGNLAREILSKYGDVYTADIAKTRNKVIRAMIEEYEQTGKFKILLNSIEDNAFYEDKRSIAAAQLKKLLESPDFTPEIVDEVGNSILHIAAALPDDMGRTLIQMALDKGIDINVGNCTGQRPLMSAIKKLITTEDNAGKMNLMSNIKFLLDKGVDINAQDNNGQTAFHFACMSTVAALLTLLLSHEPNVFLRDKMGNRAAKYLKTEEMKEIYGKYLLKN